MPPGRYHDMGEFQVPSDSRRSIPRQWLVVAFRPACLAVGRFSPNPSSAFSAVKSVAVVLFFHSAFRTLHSALPQVVYRSMFLKYIIRGNQNPSKPVNGVTKTIKIDSNPIKSDQKR
jgi:hypothetical protein